MSPFRICFQTNISQRLVKTNVFNTKPSFIYRKMHLEPIKSVLHKDCAFHSPPLNHCSFQKKPKPGTVFTDHMLQLEYDEKLGGWQKPTIIPFSESMLQFGDADIIGRPTISESLKAYIGIDRKMRLFRPELKFDIFNKAAETAFLPQINAKSLLNGIKNLISVDKHWIPTCNMNCLDIATTMTAVQYTVFNQSAEKARLFVTLSPCAGPHLDEHRAIKLTATSTFQFMSNSLQSNYLSNIPQDNFHQALLLYGMKEQITQTNSLNIFLLHLNEKEELELLTPPLNGLIYPGIERASIIELAKLWKINVKEEEITMSALANLIEKNKLLEMFGCGSANVISPVSQIIYKGQLLKIRTVKHNTPLYFKFYDAFIKMLYGKVRHHRWTPVIDVGLYDIKYKSAQ